MKRTAYQPPDVFVPAGKTYSHGIIVEAGRTLYVAGQTSREHPFSDLRLGGSRIPGGN